MGTTTRRRTSCQLTIRNKQGKTITNRAPNWKDELPHVCRERIVKKIVKDLETCMLHNFMPHNFQVRSAIENLAQTFEARVYTVATSQSDYLRRISLKMLALMARNRETMRNSWPSNIPVGS